MKARRLQPTQADYKDFIGRYILIIEAAATRIHTLALRGQQYTSTADVAEWIIKNLPDRARQTWGRGFKTWRVTSMLSHARFLGAFEALDIKSVHGKGLTPVVMPRKTQGRVPPPSHLWVQKGTKPRSARKEGTKLRLVKSR
jgi:hypothetical protein